MAKAMKPCGNVDIECERMMPAKSKHKFCDRCRAYDRRVSEQNPLWIIGMLSAYARRGHLLAPYVPKKERSNVHFVEFRPSTIPQVRKRAANA